MAHDLRLRQLLVSTLAAWHGVSRKQIAIRIGTSEANLSQYLNHREIDDELFERLLAAIGATPTEVRIATAYLEALAALEENDDLIAEEQSEIEEAALESARLTRRILAEELRRARHGPALDLCLELCDASGDAASREVEAAAGLARLARQVAEEELEPGGFRTRLTGRTAAYGANVLRVAGELPEAETAFVEAKRLWDAGSDPSGLLDPGRMLDLEASLRRSQRRFDEALACLDEALETGRSPARALINKGFTLEVMGEYGRAVEALLQAGPALDPQADPRLWYNQRLNLSVCYTHLQRFEDAAQLADETEPVVAALGDALVLLRITWLRGRIAAGQGRTAEARELLAEARRQFAARGMSYDVALALLEEAVLLLHDGRTAEVKELARELQPVFAAKGVHREALAALRLFEEAAENEAVTAGLARRVLDFLFRARYDQGLRFTDS